MKGEILSMITAKKLSKINKAIKELHNSKEYKLAKAMDLNAQQSILIKLDKILNGGEDNE